MLDARCQNQNGLFPDGEIAPLTGLPAPGSMRPASCAPPSRRGHSPTTRRPDIMTDTLIARKSSALNGTVSVPGDKSISHRALMLGGISTGVTRITGLLEGEDVLATARAVEALGAGVKRAGSVWEVRGRGVGGLEAPAGPLDFGNSGTGARLMMGIVAGHPFDTSFAGDASLCSRPMGRVLAPLCQMGASVKDGREKLPLTLQGTGDLVPMIYTLPVASAQVKSAVLLAGLHASGETSVIEHEATRDHTERMLAHFGADVRIEDGSEGRTITVRGDAELAGCDVAVPGDPSSAAFLAAAAAIVPGSDITIRHVLVNPTRAGFYETLREMGADMAFENARDESGEPVADLRVRHSPLAGVTVPAARAPSMIDEYPILSVVASFAQGETRMQGLAELRVKESDRLASTAAGLAACGVDHEIDGDCLIVRGTGAAPGGARVTTHMDHRIAMAFLVMGLAADEPVAIDDASMIATSFTGFAELMTGLGAVVDRGNPA